MRMPTGPATTSTTTRRPRVSGSTNAGVGTRASGTSSAASRSKAAADRRVAAIKAERAAARRSAPIIDVPATLDYLRKNPVEAAKLYAETVFSMTPAGMGKDIAENVGRRDAAGSALALAGAVPFVPGGKVAAAAGKVAKVAGAASKAAKAAKPAAKAAGAASKAAKSGQTVEAAIGAEKAAALRAAAGTKPAPKPRTVRVPKTKPKPPKTKAALDRYWNETVPAWNKANPNDKIVIPTSGPVVGKAATATRAEVATSEAAMSTAEKATVAAGRRQAAKGAAKARGARTRAAKAADPNTPKPARTRSKTKVMPESGKPPVKAVEAMMPDVRKAAAARTKALAEDGPTRADLGIKGSGPSAAKSTDARVANFEQRMADIRAARNRGDLPSYETQEVVGAGTVPTARPVRSSVKTPKQVAREGVDTERKTRGGMKRIDQGARAADVRSGGKDGRMAASGEKITRTQVNKYKKQYDPDGGNPLDPKTDLSKYPPAVREYMVQARAEASSLDRTSANTARLMDDMGRNPGTGARAPQPKKGPDQVPMNRQADANLRAKNPRKGLGKGSQSKDKPASALRTRDGKPVTGTGKFKPETDGIDGPGLRGKAASDGSTLPTTKGRSVTGSGDGGVTDSGYPGLGDVSGRTRGARSTRPVDTSSPAQKPPGAADKPAAKKPTAKKTTAKKTTAAPKPKRPRSVTSTPAWTKWDPKDITLKPNAKDRAMQARLDKVLGDKKPKAPEKPASQPSAETAPKPNTSRTRKPKDEAPAEKPTTPTVKKPSTKAKPKAKDETPDNVRPIESAPSKAKGGKGKPKKPTATKPADPMDKVARNRGKRTLPEENPVFRNPRKDRTDMAVDLLKGRGMRRSKTTKLAAATVAGLGGAAAYGRAKGTGTQDVSAKPAKPVPGADKAKDNTKPKRKPVMVEKDGDKYVLDQYGRRISPAEYKRRLAEKKARENAKTPEERLRLYKQQVARREKYRNSKAATSKYGKRATKVTKKPSVRVGETLRKAAKN